MSEKKTKHVVIQSRPPKKKKKMEQHPILPDPIADLPLEHGEYPEELDIYQEADTGKLKSGDLSILDKVFKGLPIKLKEKDDD